MESEKLRETPDAPLFSYDEAFSRNLGWVTAFEQQELRYKRIAIAGMGGVGGSHLLTLTRLGIGAFNIADFDNFELANFNRQAGASLSSIGKSKADTMAEMARTINPELDIRKFKDGVTDNNINSFLEGVDVYLDGLDFFVLDTRRKIFSLCHELGIPAVTAAPAGMGAAYLVFTKDGMSFEDYFCMRDFPKDKQMVHFLLGLTPAGLHRSYLVDKTRFDIKNQRVPSTGLSCELCAGVAAAQILKLLLKRGPIYAAPWYHHFDAYKCKWKRARLVGGNANLLQRFKIAITHRQFERLSNADHPPLPVHSRAIEAIFDQARWAPSGDNTQPWRFEIIDDSHAIIYLATAKARSIEDFYDFDNGVPTLLAGGGLLESIRIAATCHHRDFTWSLDSEENGVYRLVVNLPKNPTLKADKLANFISTRSVNRDLYRTTPLSDEQKRALMLTLGDEFSISWHETFLERWQQAINNAMATDIRLRIPEAFKTHMAILDWTQKFSLAKVPIWATGLDWMTCKLMHWLMKDWRRIDFMNRFGGGTLIAQLEMGLLPGLFCSSHFIIYYREQDVVTSQKYLQMGQTMQRFWLTATSMGLVMQPNTATHMFSLFGQRKDVFTNDSNMLLKSVRLGQRLMNQIGKKPSQIAFIGRIGYPRKQRSSSRSVRLPLTALYAKEAPAKTKPSLYDYYHSIFDSVIADTDALRNECYKLRYKVYCLEYDWQKNSNKFNSAQLEKDEYDTHSVHALLRHRETGLFIGTVRLILHPENATTGVFPVHKICTENNLQIPQLVPLKNMAEISRFCISRELRRRVADTLRGSGYTEEELAFDRARIIPAMSLGLISMLFLLAKQHNVKQWCAEMEPFLIDLLAKLGIYFDPVGPLIEFHGQRQVCHKLVDDWVNRISQERPDIWEIVTDKGRYYTINNSRYQSHTNVTIR